MTTLTHNCSEELKEAGLKVTPIRLETMQFLEKSDQPVDANTIHDHLNENNINADPATVFRMMNLFTEKGITKQVKFLEVQTRYELSNKKHHHHLLCVNCGRVEEVEGDLLKLMEDEIYSKNGFKVDYHTLEFYGHCKNCLK